MAPITIPSITQLSDPPSKASPSDFAAKADIFLGELPDFTDETNAVITELNKISSGLDQTTPIDAYSAATTYDFPDTCAGSDGYTYRCKGTSVLDDDPVGSVTGDWTMLSFDVDDALSPYSTTSTVNAALDLKANLASPAFTGGPTAPTASGTDATTLIATTAQVLAAINSGFTMSSNANGRYFKFSNGLLVALTEAHFTPTWTAAGSVYKDYLEIDAPVTGIDGWMCTVGGATFTNPVFGGSAADLDTDQYNLNVWSPTNSTTLGTDINIIGVNRWK